jgi:hypothetical protein
MNYTPVNDVDVNENSSPGVYLGITKQGDLWFPIITFVVPKEFRSAEQPAVMSGKLKNHPGSRDLMEVEAFVRGELREKVTKMIGPNLERIVEMQPVGSA